MEHKNRQEQTNDERRHIECFLRLVNIDCPYEFGDSPDAVLTLNGRRVGLERLT